MSLQIDFVKKGERRFQSFVSLPVMVLGSAGIVVALTLLVALGVGMVRINVSMNLDRAKKELARLEPMAAKVRANQAALGADKKILDRFEKEGDGAAVPMARLLYAVQKEVPAKLALEHLFAGIEPAAGKEPAYATLRLSGRAGGELVAVDAKRGLSLNEYVKRFCGDVRLVSTQHPSENEWVFALEGRRAAGEASK